MTEWPEGLILGKAEIQADIGGGGGDTICDNDTHLFSVYVKGCILPYLES